MNQEQITPTSAPLTARENIAEKRDMRMSEDQFANIVGVSPRTLRGLRQTRKIQFRRIGRTIFYLPEDIDAFYAYARKAPLASRKA